jgi:hypothetical protein
MFRFCSGRSLKEPLVVKVRYRPPHDIAARLLALRPYRDELCRLLRDYRFSSPEYRRLIEAAEALDAVCALLAGRRDLLHIPLERSRWTPPPPG